MGFVIQLVVFLLFPVAAIVGARKFPPLRWLGPIVVCYAFGIILANLGLTPAPTVAGIDGADPESTQTAAELLTSITVILAIPLLLFSADFRRWLRIARPAGISFVLSMVSIITVSAFTVQVFDDLGADSSAVAGMTVGVYTGGTPNMAAIGRALDVPDTTFIALNAADLAASAVYLLLLMTVAVRVLRRFLPAFVPAAVAHSPGQDPLLLENPVHDGESEQQASHDDFADVPPVPSILKALGLGVIVVVLTAGATLAILGTLDSQGAAASVILGVTTLGIAASFIPAVREAKGTYEVGQYLFLVFAVAIGSQANIAQLADSFATVFPYLALTLFLSVAVHYALCKVFSIDADTAIITSAAAVFGPPFVGPIASVLGNREVIVSGMATGVVGLAVGNYAGLAVAAIL